MLMKSATHGGSTSAVEVSSISRDGFSLIVDGEELAVPFDQFPWFRDATVGQISHVERPAAHHLYWPELDIDLAVASIRDPARFPLVARQAS
jgi:hypothetical protein